MESKETTPQKSGRKQSSATGMVSVTNLKTDKTMKEILESQLDSVKTKRLLRVYSMNEHVNRGLMILEQLNLFNYETGDFDLSRVREFVSFERGQVQSAENEESRA